MTHSAPPRALLCDLDGTLYGPGPIKLLMAAELLLLGPTRIGLLRRFREAHEALREEIREDPSRSFSPSPFEEQVRRAALAGSHEEAVVRAVVQEWMVERPGKWLARTKRHGLLAEIATFREAGGKTAVVSDYPATPKLRSMGIESLFDRVVSSGEHRRVTRLKPAPDGFLIAAEELGVEPEHCLVLGDREDADGEAARAAGMRFRLIGK